MIELSQEQQKAFDALMDFLKSGRYTYPYFVLSGCAGSGKTSILAVLYDALLCEQKNVSVLAYTGRAASVLRAKGIPSAQTIHSFLYKPIYNLANKLIGWKKKTDIPEEYSKLRATTDYILVDESSMVSEKIFEDLIETHLPLGFVGDAEQLPPVEEVKKEFELMQNFDFNLTEIHRQALENPIIRLSQEIRENNRYDRKLGDNQAIKFVSKKDFYREDGLRKCYNFINVILCRYNNTRREFNANYRKLLNYDGDYAKPGELIICLKNDIFNGQMFYNGERFDVLKVSEPYQSDKNSDVFCRNYDLKNTETQKCFESIPIANISWDNSDWQQENQNASKGIGYFTYGYTLTTHKAQGSEFSEVLFYDESDNRYGDQRRFRYTAVTRAKEKLRIVL